MNEMSNDVLTDSFLKENTTPRNKILPLWIKIFSWIFLLLGFFTPIVLIVGIISHNLQLSVYGIETDVPLSPTGLFLAFLFIFKGFVSFGFLKHTDWAIKLGIIDAISGILICSAVMIYLLISMNHLSLRLELVALIPYLVKLKKIKTIWENGIKN